GTISASTTTGVVTLNLSAQQGATQAGTGSITGNQLLLLGTGTAGSFALGTSNTNAVDAIAASTAASILYKNSQALTVCQVGTTLRTPSTTSDGDLATQPGPITLTNAVNTGAASTATVRLQSAGSIAQNNAGVITAANLGVVVLGLAGNITLDAANNAVTG